jgi:hypothetical protein
MANPGRGSVAAFPLGRGAHAFPAWWNDHGRRAQAEKLQRTRDQDLPLARSFLEGHVLHRAEDARARILDEQVNPAGFRERLVPRGVIRSLFREVAQTVNPEATSNSAVARPMPELAPVRKTFFPGVAVMRGALRVRLV